MNKIVPKIVQQMIDENKMITIEITKGESLYIAKMLWEEVCKAESELQAIRDCNTHLMPAQLRKKPLSDLRYQIDPWCSLVMYLRQLYEVFTKDTSSGNKDESNAGNNQTVG